MHDDHREHEHENPWAEAPPWAIAERNERRRNMEEIMSRTNELGQALDDLNTAQSSNFAEMDELLTKIGTPGTSDADVDAAIARIRVLIDASNAEVAKAKATEAGSTNVGSTDVGSTPPVDAGSGGTAVGS